MPYQNSAMPYSDGCPSLQNYSIKILKVRTSNSGGQRPSNWSLSTIYKCDNKKYSNMQYKNRAMPYPDGCPSLQDYSTKSPAGTDIH